MAATVPEIVEAIFRLAQDRDVDSATMMQAVAEVTAITSATLDLRGPIFARVALDDRLETFAAHVRARYSQALTTQVRPS